MFRIVLPALKCSKNAPFVSLLKVTTSQSVSSSKRTSKSWSSVKWAKLLQDISSWRAVNSHRLSCWYFSYRRASGSTWGCLSSQVSGPHTLSLVSLIHGCGLQGPDWHHFTICRARRGNEVSFNVWKYIRTIDWTLEWLFTMYSNWEPPQCSLNPIWRTQALLDPIEISLFRLSNFSTELWVCEIWAIPIWTEIWFQISTQAKARTAV